LVFPDFTPINVDTTGGQTESLQRRRHHRESLGLAVLAGSIAFEISKKLFGVRLATAEKILRQSTTKN
jgi:hypothetical protein